MNAAYLALCWMPGVHSIHSATHNASVQTTPALSSNNAGRSADADVHGTQQAPLIGGVGWNLTK